MTAMTQQSYQRPNHDGSGLQHVTEIDAASELDSFVYIVSHDLRNSARALTEVPQWVRDDLEAQGVKLCKDTRENFDLLERHAKRLDRMLMDLLIFSRVGRMQEVSEFSLDGLIQDVVNECAPPERVSVEVLGEMPSLVIGYKDAFILVKNVLDNVVRHSGGRPVTLRIGAQRRHSQVTITFSDNGPGIPSDDLQRMFRPMTTRVRRDEVEGSGMGLAIIQKIVAQYSGEIWAGAAPDGTGFRLRVRLRDAPMVENESQSDMLFDR